jgi:hypothetical protein
MTKKNGQFENRFVGVVGFVLFLCGTHAMAQTPPDTFYSGGPDDYQGPLSMSETWTLRQTEAPQGHVSLNNQRITLRRNQGNVWFLEAAQSLNWTPAVIHLDDHPDWQVGGETAQWRWVSTPNVMIDGHPHKICVGVPKLNTEPRRDDDTIKVAIIDSADYQSDGCGDGMEQHPGHADATR